MSDIIARLNTALEGRYVVEREIGQGGMATVYMARDLKHERTVAIKVLRQELAAMIGSARFLAEIKTTAALQHPHILSLHDSGEADGLLFYVMPFVDGENLRDRLTREHQIPVEEAVHMAADLAGALGYAHGQGVVHRDIKPANILIQSGRPVVADFGIALAASSAEGSRLTETGLSLGTPVYMSPEQAAGDQYVSASADVYSLACVLYEMLVGEPPFQGSTAQAILGKIMTGEAQAPSTLRRAVPPNVDAAIAKALEKVPADRFSTAKEFAEALKDPAFRHGSGPGKVGGDAARWKRTALVAGVAAVALLVTAILGWMDPKESLPVSRFPLAQHESEAILVSFGPSVAVAPDGSAIVYVGPGSTTPQALWVKERDAAHARRIPGTESGQQPFFFPDGRRVGFLTLDDPEPRAVKVVSLDNDEVVTLAREGFYRNGGAVGPDGRVYLNIPDLTIASLNPAGGWDPVTTLAEDDHNHLFPHPLPGGRGLLFMIQYESYRLQDAQVAVVDFSTGEHRVLMENAIMPKYAASGHIVAIRTDGTLLAAPFDEERLELTGPVAPVFEGILIGEGATQSYGADLDISRDGTLVYLAAPSVTDDTGRELVWVSRDGGERTLAPEWTAEFESVVLSPDGSRLAATVGLYDSTSVWVLDLESGAPSALTFSDGMNRRPQWSADGENVYFISDRSGRRAAYSRRADGAGQAHLLLALPDADVDEVEVSADGEWLVYRTGISAGDRDVFGLRRGDDPANAIGISTLPEIDEVSPTLSPDGRYVAYTSNETGENVVWVRTFPDPTGGRWRVSDGGGIEPLWSPDGRELYYRNSEALVAVQVRTSPVFQKGAATRLTPDGSGSAQAPYLADGLHASYAVARPGEGFVFIRMPEVPSEELIVVENFFEELKERAGG